ncbi:MAG: hypothetical protein ACYTEQ_22710 [Planctomycetota bacterium]
MSNTDLFTNVLAALVGHPARHDFYALFTAWQDEHNAWETESAMLRNRVTALEAVCHELIKNFMDEHDMGSCCVHCGMGWVWSERDANHADDCPVTTARALLSDASEDE